MTWHPKFVRRASCSSARKALSRSRSWRSWADSMASEATISTPSFCAFSARFRRFLRFLDQISFRSGFDYTSAFKSLMCFCMLLLISVLEIGWWFSELKWLIPASNQKHVGLRLLEDGEDTLGDFYYYFEPKGDRIGSQQSGSNYTIKPQACETLLECTGTLTNQQLKNSKNIWAAAVSLVSNAPFGA